ncbi:hypothetical protein AXG93_2912s1400 [Marchantia polymorpha subsp. ruderalis]|uniref:Uncharacterized protein n=1 Tax=Marchantia polymorpha subsp. ruderalis TaxID=1480154 RepID=A0A176WG05_MARPO|nr:hypothetical protein AXG93_2912s1400 [Marchantia polymorpha subsp. ruderalis]
MSKATQLRMIPLKLPQIGLRAFQHELTAVKLDFLLWGWNYVCQDMVREWQKERDQPTRGFRPHVERWVIEDWEQVLGRCAGEDGHLLFDSESIKVTKYADPRQPGSYVELVRRRTRTKVRTSKLLARLDGDIQDLRLKNEALRGHIALSRKLQKAVDQTRDEKFEEAKKEFAKEKAKLADELDSEQTQNQILLEQCQLARQVDEELIRKLQSEFGELSAQRADAELHLVVVEDDRRREADRTKEELVKRVNHCLRGYTLWEVAAQEKLTLRELELRAVGLMSGDSRSRRRVAKKLDAYLSRSRDAMANLEAELNAVLRQLGLRSQAEDWSGRELARGSPSRRSHSTGSAGCCSVV